ncbi:MAG: transglycosylase SLT domain-containing protein, partial [Streptomycetaceae bacterium]|nr:transglycosylase SLT domain-containing protein [Streptomycetaceae bacterium]
MHLGLGVALAGGGLVAAAGALTGITYLAAMLPWDPGGGDSTGLSGGLNTEAIPQSAKAYVPYIQAAGSMCPEVTPALIAGQIEAESSWNPRNVSPVGAQGLSQFMPETFPSYARDEDGSGNGPDPFNPQDAIMAQGRFDCSMVDVVHQREEGTYRGGCQLRSGAKKPAPAPGEFRKGQDLVSLIIAGYNAGPGAVCYYRGVPPFAETTKYIPTVIAAAAKYRLAEQAGDANCTSGDLNQCALQKAREFADPAWVKQHYPDKGDPPIRYSWGGGGARGPGYGIKDSGYDDRNIFGFDCSGLVQYAFYQGSSGANRVMLSRTADRQAREGELVAEGYGRDDFDLSKVRPGDAIAFGEGPGYYHHISIYNGGRQVVNAWGDRKPV